MTSIGESSDVDLLVEFDDMPHADRADAYLGFLTAVEALLQRRVDLVEVGAVPQSVPASGNRGIARARLCRVTRGRGSRTSC